MSERTAQAFLQLSEGNMRAAIYKMAAQIDHLTAHIDDAIELLPDRPGRALERLSIAAGHDGRPPKPGGASE